MTNEARQAILKQKISELEYDLEGFTSLMTEFPNNKEIYEYYIEKASYLLTIFEEELAKISKEKESLSIANVEFFRIVDSSGKCVVEFDFTSGDEDE